MKMGSKIALTAAALACLAGAPTGARAAERCPAVEPAAGAWQARALSLLAVSEQLGWEFQELEARLALLERDVREAKERRTVPDRQVGSIK